MRNPGSWAVFVVTLSMISTLVRAEEKSAENFAWLKPGFEAVILPATNSGQSVTIEADDEGIMLCSNITASGDGSVSGPTHCNNRITPVGFHIPPGVLFEKKTGFFSDLETKLKELGSFALAAAPMGLAAFNLGATSQAAQGVANVVNADPMQEIEAKYQLRKTLETTQTYAQESAKRKDGIVPVGIIPYDFADISASLNKRVDDYVKKCQEHYEGYCKQQMENVTFAANIMKICNIYEVPPQAGEPGQASLWNINKSLPPTCADELLAEGPTGEFLLKWALSHESAEAQKASSK